MTDTVAPKKPAARKPAAKKVAPAAAPVNAASAEDHVAAVKALDRLLMAGRYVIPVSYPQVSRIAHARRLHHPERLPIYGDWPGFLPDVWWSAE